MKYFLTVAAMVLPLLTACIIYEHDHDDGYHHGHHHRDGYYHR